jgi:hypothetical protein
MRPMSMSPSTMHWFDLPRLKPQIQLPTLRGTFHDFPSQHPGDNSQGRNLVDECGATFRARAPCATVAYVTGIFRGTPKTGSNRDNDAVIVGLVSWERFYDPIICRIDIGPVCRMCVRE